MHPNPIFRKTDASRNFDFARDRSFGALSINGDDGPLMSHVPFLLAEDNQSLDLHLVRSNPIARALDAPVRAVIAVTGPDSYISPDWYGVTDQVPTWNYVAVHLRGTLERLPDSELRDVIDRQSARFEDQLAPKTPWTTAKMTPDVLEKMMRQIVPFRMRVESVGGTWKLNQNKPDTVRESAAGFVNGYGMGSEPAMLAALMLAPPRD